MTNKQKAMHVVNVWLRYHSIDIHMNRDLETAYRVLDELIEAALLDAELNLSKVLTL